MKRISLCFSFYVILFFHFCFFTHVESKDLKQRLPKDHSQVRAIEVVRAGFGSGPNNIGIITPDEANPEGPMSFALGRNEEIYILDQINSRIQIFKDGKRTRTIPTPVMTFMDINITPDNKIVLLDSLVKRVVYILDSRGKILNVIPLEGKLISDAAVVTGIYSREGGRFSGVWVEVENRSVLIASHDGTPVPERISVSGLLSLNGRRLIRANKIGDATALIYRSKEDSFSKWDEYTFFFDMYVDCLLGLWDDRDGRIYLGAALIEEPKSFNMIVVFTPEGKELGRVKLFIQKMPHEIFHSVRVSPEGYVFQMALDDRGVFVRRYELTY